MKKATYLTALLFAGMTFSTVHGNPPAKVQPSVKTTPKLEQTLHNIPLTVVNNSTGDINCVFSTPNYTPPIPCPGFVSAGFDKAQYQTVISGQSRVFNLMCLGPVIGPSIVQVDCNVPAAYPDKRVMHYSISGLQSLGPVIYNQIKDPNDPYLNKGTLSQQ